jgi:hypothetical protein
MNQEVHRYQCGHKYAPLQNGDFDAVVGWVDEKEIGAQKNVQHYGIGDAGDFEGFFA